MMGDVEGKMKSINFSIFSFAAKIIYLLQIYFWFTLIQNTAICIELYSRL